MRRLGRLEYQPQERRTVSTSGFIKLLLLLVVLIAGFLFINSSFFCVGAIEVEGNKYMETEEVYRIAGIPDQTNIFRIDTAEIRNRLTRDLRVAEVEVIRRFPGTVVIRLKERQPLAYVASGYGFIELDKQGVVLAAYKNLKHINVPMITGIRIDNGYVGDTIDNRVIQNALIYLAFLEESTLNQLSEVNIKSSEQIYVYTTNSVQIRLGSSERLAEKAKLTHDILKEVSDKKLAVEYIDLNFASPVIKFKQ